MVAYTPSRVWRALTDHSEFGTWFRVKLDGPFRPGQTPTGHDAKQDYSGETPTLVTFTLEKIPTGTRLTVVESGFDRLPAHRRDEAFRMSEGGWAAQVENITRHVAPSP